MERVEEKGPPCENSLNVESYFPYSVCWAVTVAAEGQAASICLGIGKAVLFLLQSSLAQAICPPCSLPASELPGSLLSQPLLSLFGFALTPPEDPLAPCIAPLVASRNLAELSRFQTWERNSSVFCRHCGSISGPVLSAMISAPQLRCSTQGISQRGLPLWSWKTSSTCPSKYTAVEHIK